MKKFLKATLILGLVLGILCTSVLASDRVEKFDIKDLKDFDVENGNIYILDEDKIKIRTYENVDLEIDLKKVPGYESGERLNVDGGVIYILDSENSKITMVIYGSPGESKTFQISDLSKVLKKNSDIKDVAKIGEFKVINGEIYLNNNQEKNESYIFQKDGEKFLEKEVLENIKFMDSFYTSKLEDSLGILTIDGKHKLEIRSQGNIKDIKLIGKTTTGKYLVEVDEYLNNKTRSSVRVFSSEYKEIDNIDIRTGNGKSQDLYNKARFEDGNLYYLDGDSNIVVRKIDVKNISFNLFLNGELTDDKDSFIKDGRTFVPIRLISEKLGFDVLYVENNKDIIISKDGQKIQMNVENMDIVKDEKNHQDGYPTNSKK